MTRRVWRLVALGALFSLVACGQSTAPSSTEVVRAAVTAFGAVRTVHFRLSIENGGIELLPGMLAREIEGDVARPDRIQARIKAEFRSLPIRLEFRSIGDERWITNPLAPGRWERLPNITIVRALLDPQAGVTAIAEAMRELEPPETTMLAGVEVYRIAGRTPNEQVADYLGGTPLDGWTAVELWIGTEDSLVRRAVLVGPTVAGDEAGVVRSLEFSRFDEPVEIVAPV